MADNLVGPSTAGFWLQGEPLPRRRLPANPHGLLLVRWDGAGPLELSAPLEAWRLQSRLDTLEHFAAAAAVALVQRHSGPVAFAVQVHDEEPAWPCFRFDAPLHPRAEHNDGPLIPDPYALGSWGYAELRRDLAEQGLPPWCERLPLAFWRGSSTGLKALTPARIWQLKRHQLCELSRLYPQWLDARFTAVVQARDAQAQAQLNAALQQRGRLAPRCAPWDAALHRWLIEIDGNVNSWGLLWKLFSGSCLLWVASERRQWYHHRLVAWQHYVPVAADLSNLIDRLAWCRAHPAACAAIADAARRLAGQVVADLELDMLAAVHTYPLTAAWPIR